MNRMEQKWIVKQTEINVAQWDNVMETFYPESKLYLRDPNEYVKRLCIECNYLDAVKVLDWNKLLKTESVILDLACGGGWLSAYLSSFNQVKTIYALDSSKRFLSELLYPTTKILNGNPHTISLRFFYKLSYNRIFTKFEITETTRGLNSS